MYFIFLTSSLIWFVLDKSGLVNNFFYIKLMGTVGV